MHITKGADSIIVRYFDEEDYEKNTTVEQRMWDSIQSFHDLHFACSSEAWLYPSLFETYEKFKVLVRSVCNEAGCDFVEPIEAWEDR